MRVHALRTKMHPGPPRQVRKPGHFHQNVRRNIQQNQKNSQKINTANIILCAIVLSYFKYRLPIEQVTSFVISNVVIADLKTERRSNMLSKQSNSKIISRAISHPQEN